MKASDSTFNLSDVAYQSGSIMNSGDLSGDTFNETLYVPYTDVANLGGNASFDGVYIEPATLPSGATLSLDQVGSGSSLTYVFYSGFSVASGATLDVGANLPVQIGAGQTLSDAGTMTFGSGDMVTFGYGYGDTTALTVSGTLNASEDNFSAASLGSNTTYLNVAANGELKAGDSTFNLSYVSYQSGSIFNNGDLSGDTFNETLYVPYTDVQYLGGNASFDDIYIETATLPSGATLSLDQVGSGSSLTYVFYSGFSVASGATLDVGANLAVQIGAGQTLSDSGTITLGSGDTVTFVYGYGDTTTMSVSGILNASEDNFLAASLSSNTTQIQVNSGGVLNAADETAFNVSNLTLNSGSSATMSTDVLSGVFTINSNTTLNVTGNDFSNLTTPDGLVAAGGPGTSINVAGNYWGTDVAGIDAIILDSNDNPSLPTVNFQPYIQYTTGISAFAQSVTFTPSPNSPSFPLTADVFTSSGLVINEGTMYFTILDGTTPLGQTTSGMVENGSATVTYTTLPPGTAAGLYTIEATFSDDGLNNYLPATDTSHFLTVTPAATTTTVSNASATYSDVSDQSIPLTRRSAARLAPLMKEP